MDNNVNKTKKTSKSISMSTFPVFFFLFFPVVFVLVCTAALNILNGNVSAVEVKKIDIHRFEDFQLGEFSGTGLDSRGRLFIGPPVRKIPGPAREYYLALDIAANGDIYVGTGHNAVVYRVKPSASIPAAGVPPASAASAETGGTASTDSEEIFSSEALDVFAVLVKSNGDVYAGTSPEGEVYKISRTAKDKKGNAEKSEFFDPEEKFIWDLKEDQAGNIICAVGNSGGVYRIDAAGQADKIFAPEDTHIISLYITKSGSILAGSGDRGILYRIDNRKVKVLFDSPFEEIRGICEDKNGNIYFSATRGIFKENLLDDTGGPKLLKKKKKDEEEEIKIPEKSILYCLYTNGIVEKPWTSRTEYIYSAYYDEKSDSVVIGTGDSGRVYQVKKDGSFAIIYESDSAQVFKIAGKGKGFALITNNTASIAAIEDTPGEKGSYFSDVYDLQIQSRLGRLYWEARTPPQTEVQLFTRTGNSNVPDKTWTQWSAPLTDGENSTVGVSDCRYFQVKVVLSSKNSLETPYLEGFKVFYIQSNIAPQVKKIEITKPLPRPEGVDIKIKPVPEKAVPFSYLNVKWKAEDRNKDKLKYNIYIKKYNARNWILIKEDIPESEFKLNTDLYQDGKYLLRVAADDSLANPPAMARSHALESVPFLIDSTAPVISDFIVTGTHLRFNVKDQTSIIASVLYSFDGKLWYPVFPVDMLNDSKSETYDVDLKNPGTKAIIFLKALDEFGNCSVLQEEL
jgi:sugar lactone lactonase YvrE